MFVLLSTAADSLQPRIFMLLAALVAAFAVALPLAMIGARRRKNRIETEFAKLTGTSVGARGGSDAASADTQWWRDGNIADGGSAPRDDSKWQEHFLPPEQRPSVQPDRPAPSGRRIAPRPVDSAPAAAPPARPVVPVQTTQPVQHVQPAPTPVAQPVQPVAQQQPAPYQPAPPARPIAGVVPGTYVNSSVETPEHIPRTFTTHQTQPVADPLPPIAPRRPPAEPPRHASGPPTFGAAPAAADENDDGGDWFAKRLAEEND